MKVSGDTASAESTDLSNHLAKHHPLLGQPHDEKLEGPVAHAERTAASLSTAEQPLGPLGQRFNWHSSFFIGLAAAAGVVVTIGFVEMFLVAAQTLLLIGMGLFLAVGLEPAVSWLINHRFPRWAAVISVSVVLLAIVGSFLAAAVPALVDQGGKLIQDVPGYIQQLDDSNSLLGQLNDKIHLKDNVEQFLNSSGSGLASGIVSVGETILSTFSSSIIVLVLTAYFLADMPRVRATMYRFVPAQRRPGPSCSATRSWSKSAAMSWET